MDRDDVERLVRVEAGLQVVQHDLREHRDESSRKHDELKAALTQLGAKLDERAFRWSSLLTGDTAKVAAYVILSLAGAAGAASALFK